MDISQGAYDTHGITREYLNDKPKFKEIAKDFHKFIGENTLVIHNADFDQFLNKELKDAGLSRILKSNVKDTLNIAGKNFLVLKIV